MADHLPPAGKYIDTTSGGEGRVGGNGAGASEWLLGDEGGDKLPRPPPSHGHRRRIVSRDLHSRPTTWGSKILFTLPQFSTGVVGLFRDYWLNSFYANHVKLDLSYIALTLSVFAGIHVLFNPIVGWFIDRSKHTRWLGPKGPYIAVGAVIEGIAFIALCIPPDPSASQSRKFVWFLGTRTVLGLASATLSTAYSAQSVQFTISASDRTFVFGLQRWFWQVGGLVGAAGPPYFIKWAGNDAYAAYRVFAIAAGTLQIISYIILVFVVKEKEQLGQEERAANPVPALVDSCYNTPFRQLMIVYALWRLIPSLPAVIQNRFLFKIEHNTLQGETFFVGYICVAASLPIWLFASKRIEKRTGFNLSLVFGELLPQVVLVCAPYLPRHLLTPAFFFFSVIGSFTARVTFEEAMLADCIEYDQLYSGKRREGQYQGAENTLLNFAAVFRNAVGFAILAAAGYEEGSLDQPAAVVTAAQVVAAIPIVIMFVLQGLMMRYKLTKARHKALVTAVAAHQHGHGAVDPLTEKLILPPDEVDPEVHALVSHFWRFERVAAVEQGPASVLRLVVLQAVGFFLVSAACFVGVKYTGGHRELDTINNMLLNGGIVCLVMVAFNLPRVAAARRLPSVPEALAHLRHGTGPGMPGGSAPQAPPALAKALIEGYSDG